MGRKPKPKPEDIPGNFLPNGWGMPCPMGGKCIDPGNPTDCEINRMCISFRSCQEKRDFDSSPNKFMVRVGNEPGVCFKTQAQVDFYLTDLPLKHREVAQVIPLDTHNQ